MATSFQIEKLDRPELAKHDSSILGKFLFINFYEYMYIYIFRSRICNGLYGFNGILYC